MPWAFATPNGHSIRHRSQQIILISSFFSIKFDKSVPPGFTHPEQINTPTVSLAGRVFRAIKDMFSDTILPSLRMELRSLQLEAKLFAKRWSDLPCCRGRFRWAVCTPHWREYPLSRCMSRDSYTKFLIAKFNKTRIRWEYSLLAEEMAKQRNEVKLMYNVTNVCPAETHLDMI